MQETNLITLSFPIAYEQPVGAILGVVSLVVFVVGIWGAFVLYRQPNHRLRNVIIGAWALLPPIYFLINYYVIFRIYGHWSDGDAVAHYRHSQGLFTKLWAAVGALIALISSGKLKSRSAEANTQRREAPPQIEPKTTGCLESLKTDI